MNGLSCARVRPPMALSASLLALLLFALPAGSSVSGAEPEDLLPLGSTTESTARLPDDLQSRITTIVDMETVDFGTNDTDLAVCPSGTVALGGGIAVEVDLLMTITSSGPMWKTGTLINAADGPHGPPAYWRSSARNGDSTVRDLNSAAICAPHSAVSTEVASNTVSAGANAYVAAVCPLGTVAVGGGVDVSLPPDMRVTASGPTVGGNRLYAVPDGTYGAPGGWWAAVRNYSGSDQAFKVAAICQPLGGVSTVVTSDVASSGEARSKSALCPAGTIATGGGSDSQNIYSVLVTASAPVFGPAHEDLMAQPYGKNPAPTGWEATVRNEHAESRSFKVAVICARWPMEIFRGDEAPTPDR